MNSSYRGCFVLLLALAALPIVWAQASDADSALPLLILDEVFRIVTDKDRAISELDETKARGTVAQAKTNYLPKLDSYVSAGSSLQSSNFSVPAGSFGTYPGLGADQKGE